MKLLLVEDERYIAEALEQVLKKNHYGIDLAFDGEYGLECGLTDVYDIILLDVMLPKMDGFRVLRELRKNRITTPILLLTAKGQVEDKVKGLDYGADDYLAKPFHTDELLARLRALGRRKAELTPDGVLRFGDIEFNPHILTLNGNDKECTLTLKEAGLLELLVARKNMTTSKETILERLWGYDSDAEDSHVENQVSLLRKKLSLVRSTVCIRTIRGAGYLLEYKEGGSFVQTITE